MPDALAIGRHLDALLRTSEIPDYPSALNGLQLEGRGEVTHVATAVDFSLRVVEEAVRRRVQMLIVHHGMFWGGLQPVTGVAYARLSLLLAHDIAVYASHLPLDLHPELGNNVLLARALGLEPDAGFARYKTVDVGVSGASDVATRVLAARAGVLAQAHGGSVIATPFE